MKNALLVGINYKGTNYQLNGCINDVTNMSKFLKTVLKYDKITEITDDTRIKPTRANIISNLVNMVKNSKRGDRLLFLYSGHGSLVKDQNGDETSGYDPITGQSRQSAIPVRVEAIAEVAAAE